MSPATCSTMLCAIFILPFCGMTIFCPKMFCTWPPTGSKIKSLSATMITTPSVLDSLIDFSCLSSGEDRKITSHNARAIFVADAHCNQIAVNRKLVDYALYEFKSAVMRDDDLLYEHVMHLDAHLIKDKVAVANHYHHAVRARVFERIVRLGLGL